MLRDQTQAERAVAAVGVSKAEFQLRRLLAAQVCQTNECQAGALCEYYAELATYVCCRSKISIHPGCKG